ncbi:hypothetical protein TIFTF001_022304 [Ficus carica]|uniref:Uncharacterized protein n=1 Tax=Ficus carica TaxID=3494 RepID=A0AA88AHK2_FICCA|nr:hypothetical protein TIFTF001_022304 [Ficus carica]
MSLKAWSAAAAHGYGERALVPDLYVARSHFLHRDFSFVMPPAMDGDFKIAECVKKRLVFVKSKVTALKATTVSNGVKQPTRVGAVTALIWKCADFTSRLNSGYSKNSILTQVVNIRKRVEPPFVENSVGNLIDYFAVQVDQDQNEQKVVDLVAKRRDGINKYSENEVRKLRGEGASDYISQHSREVGDFVRRNDANLFLCSSWCKLEFYEADFRLGTANLGDCSGKANMASFEHDPELLAFAAQI